MEGGGGRREEGEDRREGGEGGAGEGVRNAGEVAGKCLHVFKRLTNLHTCDSSTFKTRAVHNKILQEE